MSLVVDSITKRFGSVGALWIAARLYSAGVLLYGQRIGFQAVWRATRVHRCSRAA